MYFDRDSYQKSVRRAREERWRVRGRARVVHPKYGAVVVPHRSNYSALLNAAEYWGCEWTDICQYCGHRLREIGRERFCNNVNCQNRYVNV